MSETTERTRNLCQNFHETFDVSKDKDSTAIAVNCEFDLSKLHDDDILELARRSMVIAQQGRIRSWMKADPDKRAKDFQQNKYVVPIPGTRTGAKPPAEQAQKYLDKMSKEEILALLEKYNA